MPKFKVGDLVSCIKEECKVKVGDLKEVLDTETNNILIDCSCCRTPVRVWLSANNFEISRRKTLLETLDNPNEMFKFLKRELDISN